MPSDIEIAQAAKLQRISAVAREKLGPRRPQVGEFEVATGVGGFQMREAGY